MLPTAARIADALERAGIFHGLEAAVVNAIRDRLQLVHFPQGRTVFVEGEVGGEELYIIVEGKVKIGRQAPDGRENLLTIMGASDMFGELSVFDPGPRTSTATAITDVAAVSMDRSALSVWIAEWPEVAEQLLRVVARRLRRTNDNLADLIFTDVAGRVAKQLLELAQRFGAREGNHLRVTHDLTQEEIAQLVGSSRETVNKALSDFAHRGWIALEGKSVRIIHPKRLARRAGTNSAVARPARRGQAESPVEPRQLVHYSPDQLFQLASAGQVTKSKAQLRMNGVRAQRLSQQGDYLRGVATLASRDMDCAPDE